MKKTQMKKESFTFVELLMTVVTVAVFAVLMITVVGKAHADAIEASCKNNQKQIMAAALAYANDYQGYIVPGNLDSLSWNAYIVGRKRVKGGSIMGKKSYINPKSKVFFCPDEPVVTNISYSVSRAFITKGNGLSLTVDQMNPSLIYLADANPAGIKITGTPTFVEKRVSATGKGWGEAYLRHEDKVNVGKIDGSVEELDEKTFKTNNKYWTVAK
jgi:competence protein ComGC